MIEVREVLPSDEQRFAAWHAALAAGALADRVGATVSTLPELTASLGSPSPVLRRVAVGAWAGDDCVGAMLFETPLRNDLETVAVEIDVPPAHRGRGVGEALWQWAVQRAEREGRTVFQAEVYVPDGHTVATWPGARFAAARGFVSANVEDHLVVDLPYDPDRLAALEERAARHAGYRVETWTGACPEAHVRAWADLQTAMSVDVPTGELTREPVVHTVELVRTSEQRLAENWISLNALATTDAGEAVGYSTLLLPRTAPEHAYQDDTLVLRAHRGHGLGAALKVANLRALERLPVEDRAERRWLHTYTEQGNGAMQAVNARFGFRRVEVLHEYERPAAEGGVGATP